MMAGKSGGVGDKMSFGGNGSDVYGLSDRSDVTERNGIDNPTDVNYNEVGGEENNESDIKFSFSGKNGSERTYTEDEYDRYGWAIADGVLDRKDLSQFYSDVADLKKRKQNFWKTPSGKYVFETENKLIVSDGNWKMPSIDAVVKVRGENIGNVKEYIYDTFKKTDDIGFTTEVTEAVYTTSDITTRTSENGTTYEEYVRAGKNRVRSSTGTQTGDGIRADSDGTDGTGKQGVKFALPGTNPNGTEFIPKGENPAFPFLSVRQALFFLFSFRSCIFSEAVLQ